MAQTLVDAAAIEAIRSVPGLPPPPPAPLVALAPLLLLALWPPLPPAPEDEPAGHGAPEVLFSAPPPQPAIAIVMADSAKGQIRHGAFETLFMRRLSRRLRELCKGEHRARGHG